MAVPTYRAWSIGLPAKDGQFILSNRNLSSRRFVRAIRVATSTMLLDMDSGEQIDAASLGTEPIFHYPLPKITDRKPRERKAKAPRAAAGKS